MSQSQSQYLNMSNNYMKKSLIYGVREHSINQEIWSTESARLGVMEMRRRTQQGGVLHEWETQEGKVREEQ